MSLMKDVSTSAIVAGFVSVLVGFTSAGIIVFQAAGALGATPKEIASWVWALGIGMGTTTIVLSLRHRAPIVIAWSTPGAAMLITGAAGVPLAEATGAFLVSAVLIAGCGFSGWFERILNRIPMSIASGMLAGVLLRFGMDVFIAMKTQFVLAFGMFCTYVIMRRLHPRYAVVATLLVGMTSAATQGLLRTDSIRWELAEPVFTAPRFSVAALVGVALPLFVVTMASQNVPGVAVLRASGYSVPISSAIGWTGVATFVLAPFGAFALNLAAITAAICTGREAHENPARRYVAAVTGGALYIVIGLFGAMVSAVFAAFPKELVLAIAGLALFSTIGSGLATALSDEREREPALVTFLVTASGATLAGIGSAFWGLLAGVLTFVTLKAGGGRFRVVQGLASRS